MKQIIFLSSLVFSLTIFASELKLVVISDLNNSYGSTSYNLEVKRAIEYIAYETPDLVISTGDMIAGQKAGLDYFSMWEAFHQIVTRPLISLGIPFAVTPGNHDGSGYFAFRHEREIFRYQPVWQEQKLNFIDQTHYPLRYAFELKGVLFIGLDATVIGKLDDEQLNWLTKILDDNQHFEHKIAFGHLPLFPVAQNRENEYLNDGRLTDLFKKYRLTLYLAGHHHAYYPGKSQGLVQISQACLGAGPRRLIGDNKLSERGVSVITFQSDMLKIEAMSARDFQTKIDIKQLPPKIIHRNSELIRLDLDN
jgi:hypothetical protein